MKFKVGTPIIYTDVNNEKYFGVVTYVDPRQATKVSGLVTYPYVVTFADEGFEDYFSEDAIWLMNEDYNATVQSW
jgi:hypothetical protein